MTFPVYIHIGPLTLHPHLVFEALAYFLGFRLYMWTRSKEKLPLEKSIWVIIGAVLGAAAGSKALYWLEDPAQTAARWRDVSYMLEGKTIVGGLLGGLIGVEWIKKRIGVTRSTGDDMAIPLIIGMCIGRVGCFLTGLDDHTYGVATDWPTGVDFGDGVPRHPTQLYEIAYLLMLGAVLLALRGWASERRHTGPGGAIVPEGGIFQLFMFGYLLFRLAIDFWKPTPHPYFGLNNIQLASLAGLLYYGWLLSKWRTARPATPTLTTKEGTHP
ncbi:prolipoprotein diacylglyceryl transferase [Paenibacillus chartarius]|uniref:Prolipoprotein diacylglyceryl transferase n=1 Tax=Paenibacillus chartarius TaxID=747481 RepID=A0ABV6DGP1_9BACL